MIFIDGQNLLYGCKGFNKNFKFDIDRLVQTLASLEQDCELVEVFYYSSIKPPIEGEKDDEERYRRQQSFYEQLKYKYQVFIKKTKMKEIKCRLCGKTFLEPKEKGIDVAIATDFLLYGLVGEYDVAIIVSGDSDLAPVIKKLRDRKPSLRIYIAQFKHMVGVELRQAVHKFFELDKVAENFKMENK